MSENKETLTNIIGVAVGICLVCSILVATAAVALKPLQDANKRLEKRKNVLMAGGLLQEGGDVEKIFADKITPVVVDLETGEEVPKEKLIGDLDPEKFDLTRIAKGADTSSVMDAKKDLAKIKRMPKYSLLYLVKDEGKISSVIFPVYGLGLWSTMYGFLALDKDLQTVKGFTIYEHGETPGLGGEVDNPAWKATWPDKKAYDAGGQLVLKITKKGQAAPNSDREIDGLSGATITTRGVHNMIQFWFSADGFGPYIKKMKQEGV